MSITNPTMTLTERQKRLLHTYEVCSPKTLQKLLASQPVRNQFEEMFIEMAENNLENASILKRACSYFNHSDVVQKTVQRVLDAIGSDSSMMREVLACAPTQAGKSAYKAVEISTFVTMGVYPIIVTKGQKECGELFQKFQNYFEKTVFEQRLLCVCTSPEEEELVSSFKRNDGCALISHDSYQKIRLCRRVLRKAKKSCEVRFRFALLLDEADAITNRSPEGTEKNELEMAKLRLLKPIAETLVTATPLPPIIRRLQDSSKPFYYVFWIEPTSSPSSNYIGVDCHKSMTDDGGSPVFLDMDSLEIGISPSFTPQFNVKDGRNQANSPLFDDDKLQQAAKFPRKCNSKDVPWWNDQCTMMLDDLFLDGDAKGMLLLVCTSPWTTRQGNIFEQACFLQDWYRCSRGGKSFVAIMVHADKLYYRYPGRRYGFQVKGSSKSVVDVMNKVDKRFGLKMPIVVFGYHKLNRSITYRSDLRVTTHMILHPRSGQSNETVRQMAGRATYKGCDVLMENTGQARIKVLMTRDDFDLVQQYDPLIKKIVDLASQGLSWDGIYEETLDDADRAVLSNRKTGVYDIIKALEEEKMEDKKKRSLPPPCIEVNSGSFKKTRTEEDESPGMDGSNKAPVNEFELACESKSTIR